MKKDTVERFGAKDHQRMSCNSDQARDVEAFFHAVRGKWKLPILGSLAGGTLRFNELQRRLDGITQKVLTGQLRQLEAEGLVRRKVYAEVPQTAPRCCQSLARPPRGAACIAHDA
jgi:DNA-binding HxlR family transcriptional regulator